jgi:hypothetical protein
MHTQPAEEKHAYTEKSENKYSTDWCKDKIKDLIRNSSMMITYSAMLLSN